MNDLGPGDTIQCVIPYSDHKRQLRAWGLYCVEIIDAFPQANCDLHPNSPERCFGLRTADPVLPKGQYWCGRRFIPVPKGRIDSFNAILKSVPSLTPDLVPEEL